MQKVKLGTKVQPLGINRVNVADGTKCRAILIDTDPRVKYIAWDDVLKRKVEVTQDMVIKYNLRPMTNFYYLVAKLNTDMSGQVHGDQFVIEYLQLSENINNEFSDALNESGSFNSLLLTKVVKKGDGGRDFSYIKPTPSNYSPSPEILAQIEKLTSNQNALESMWALIDRATSITPAEYEAFRASDEGQKLLAQSTNGQPVYGQKASTPQIPAAPQSPAIETFQSGDDFGLDVGDDFNDFK